MTCGKLPNGSEIVHRVLQEVWDEGRNKKPEHGGIRGADGRGPGGGVGWRFSVRTSMADFGRY